MLWLWVVMNKYQNFIQEKSQLSGNFGFKSKFSHPDFYDFQAHLVEWAVQKGRAAIFADCGLGKTIMQLTCGRIMLICILINPN